jgi:hypothetical protein
MIEYIRENIDWVKFVSPGLFKLYETDQKSGTEYYKTLFWLLANNGQSREHGKAAFLSIENLKIPFG